MAVYLDKKTKRLYIQFQFRGETYKERLPPSTRKTDAESIETKMRADLLMQSHGIPTKQSSVTFESFLRDVYGPHALTNYSKDSYDRAVRMCKAALPFFKGKQLRQIRPSDVDRFVNHVKSKPTKLGAKREAATVHRDIAPISKLFSLAVRDGVIDFNPFSRVDKPVISNLQDKVLRIEDEDKFFAAFKSEWCRDICKVALYTGLRQKDILNLTRFQVDLAAGLIRITQSKTGRKHDAIITDNLRDIFERRCAVASPLVFPSPKTGTVGSQTKTAIRNACKRAKIPIITIRDLRRSSGSRLELLGVNSGTIAKFLGHSDMRSVHRYQRSADAQREAAKALENQSKSARNLPSENLRKLK